MEVNTPVILWAVKSQGHTSFGSLAFLFVQQPWPQQKGLGRWIVALSPEERAIPTRWWGTVLTEPRAKTLCSTTHKVLHSPDVAPNNDNQILTGGIVLHGIIHYKWKLCKPRERYNLIISGFSGLKVRGKFKSKQSCIAQYGMLQYKEVKIKVLHKTCQFSIDMALTYINISDKPRMSDF